MPNDLPPFPFGPFENFFNNYVMNGMLPDISREIAQAERGEGAANFLCALGLLTYTEVMGQWVPGVKNGSRNRFEAFFRRLGPCYAELINKKDDPYDLYRNGMVHTYLTKARGVVAMLEGGLVPCGAFRDEDGYHLVIERYFYDFVLACARLHEERLGFRHPSIHTWAPHLFPDVEVPKDPNEDVE